MAARRPPAGVRRPRPAGAGPGPGSLRVRPGAALRRRHLRRGRGLRRRRALRARGPRGRRAGPGARRRAAGCSLSVPAYQWAWSDHDVRAGHHRRYTRPRIVAALEAAGLRVERSTYAFALVFPMFAAERLLRRVRRPVRRPAARRVPDGGAGAPRAVRDRGAAAGPARPAVRLVGAGRGRQALTGRAATAQQRPGHDLDHHEGRHHARRGRRRPGRTPPAPGSSATAQARAIRGRPVLGHHHDGQHQPTDRERAAGRHQGARARVERGVRAEHPAEQRRPGQGSEAGREPGGQRGADHRAAVHAAQRRLPAGDHQVGDPARERGDLPHRERVRRPEQRQGGEQGGDLARRAAGERQHDRTAGEHGLADHLATGRAARGRRAPGGSSSVRRRARQADGQHRHAAYPASSAPPYAAGDSTPLVSSTSATTQRSRFSTTRTPATAPNLLARRQQSADQAHHRGQQGDRPHEQREGAAVVAEQRLPQQPREPGARRRSRPATSPATRARPPRTEPSWPSAATDRATQCWTGKVTPAAAKPQ